MSDDETPSLQELLGDLHVGGTGLPDESLMHENEVMPEPEYFEPAQEGYPQKEMPPPPPDAGKRGEHDSG